MTSKTIALLLTAKNLASGPLKEVKKDTAALGTVSGIAGKGLRTLGGNLKGAFTTPLGLLGITGGLFGLEHILSESITKAQTFGGVVSRMAKITGLSIPTTSALASALEHFGVEGDQAIKVVGMLEKNVGALTATNKKAQQFQKTYGLALVTASGHVKDANQLILDSADYFNNKSIPAQTKAAALAKLYGRNWQSLVPILSQGSKGIKDAEEEAKRLGLTLTQDNIDALKKSKAATREWNTALGGLELQIGLKLLPRITDLANAASAFVSSHGKEITQFFEDASNFAGELGSAIHDDVLPVFKGIGDAWGALPEPLKKLLIAGFVANKLSGGAITGIASELGKGLIKGVLGISAGVVNVKGAVVNGGGVPGAGGAAPVAGGGSKLGAVGGLISKALIVTAVAELANVAQPVVTQAGVDIHDAVVNAFKIDVKLPIPKPSELEWPFGPKNTPTILPDVFGGNGVLGGTGKQPQGSLTGNLGHSGPMPKVEQKIDSLHHAAVTAIEGTKASIDTTKTSVDATKAAVDTAATGTVGAQGRVERQVSTSGSNIQNATRTASYSVVAAQNSGAAQIVSAIARIPVPQTTVNVSVTAAKVTSSTSTQNSYGNSNGSAGTGGSAANDHGKN